MKSNVASILFIALISTLPGLALGGSSSAAPLATGLGIGSAKQKSLAAAAVFNRRQMEIQFQKNHVGLEILTAGSSTRSLVSAFGHSTIRLLDDDDNPMNDTVISFEMAGLGRSDDVSSGLMGEHKATAFVTDVNGFLLRYVLNEGRSFQRLILPSKPENIQALKDTIRRMMEFPNLVENYKFLTNNCLTILKNLLAEAGYPTMKIPLDVPTAFPGILRASLLTFAEPFDVASSEELIEKSLCSYLQKRKNVSICAYHQQFWVLKNLKAFTGTTATLNYLRAHLQDEGFWSFLATGSPELISLLVNFWPYSLDQSGESAETISIANQTRLLQLKTGLGSKFIPLRRYFTAYPQALYRICEAKDQACKTERYQLARTFWPQVNWEKRAEKMRGHYLNERLRARSLISSGEASVLAWLNSEAVKDLSAFKPE
jgi:hypothetical protein